MEQRVTESDAEMLEEVRRRLPMARAKLAEALPDMPTSGGGGGSGTSDRTGGIATAIMDNANDQAWADWHDLERIERIIIERCRTGQTITRPLAQLLDIVNRWAPTDKRRRALEANQRDAANDLLNRHNDQGNCTSCKQVPGAYGTPHSRGLCKTCDRWLQRVLTYYDLTDTMPRKRLVEIGEANGKVTDRDIHTVYHDCTRRADA
jgi:hypothetical protein